MISGRVGLMARVGLTCANWIAVVVRVVVRLKSRDGTGLSVVSGAEDALIPVNTKNPITRMYNMASSFEIMGNPPSTLDYHILRQAVNYSFVVFLKNFVRMPDKNADGSVKAAAPASSSPPSDPQ